MAPSDGIRWSTLDVGDDALAARKALGTGRLYAQSRLVRAHFPYGGCDEIVYRL